MNKIRSKEEKKTEALNFWKPLDYNQTSWHNLSRVVCVGASSLIVLLSFFSFPDFTIIKEVEPDRYAVIKYLYSLNGYFSAILGSIGIYNIFVWLELFTTPQFHCVSISSAYRLINILLVCECYTVMWKVDYTWILFGLSCIRFIVSLDFHNRMVEIKTLLKLKKNKSFL